MGPLKDKKIEPFSWNMFKKTLACAPQWTAPCCLFVCVFLFIKSHIFTGFTFKQSKKKQMCIFFSYFLSQWMSFIAFRTNQVALTKCGVRCDCLPCDGFFYDGTEKALLLLSSFFFSLKARFLPRCYFNSVCLPFKKKKSIFLWSKFWATYLFNLQQGSEDHSPVCVYMSECLRESLSLCLLLFFPFEIKMWCSKLRDVFFFIRHI